MHTFIGPLLGSLITFGVAGMASSAVLAQNSPRNVPATGIEAQVEPKPGASGKSDGKPSFGVDKDGGAVPQGCPYQKRKLDLIV